MKSIFKTDIKANIKANKKHKKFSKMLKFETKGLEIKAGRTTFLGRPQASITVSDASITVPFGKKAWTAGLIVGGAYLTGKVAHAGFKQAGKIAHSIGDAVHDMTSKKALAAEAEEDFMEQEQ